MKCSICNQPIERGEKVIIYSGPITYIGDDDNPDYDISEFFQKEKICHSDCYQQKSNSVNNLKPQADQPPTIKSKEDTFDYELSRRLYQTLTRLGEKTTQKDVNLFLIKNSHIREEKNLLTEWFKNRNSFD